MKKWVSDILPVRQYDMLMRDLETKYRSIPQERARLREELQAAASVNCKTIVCGGVHSRHQ